MLQNWNQRYYSHNSSIKCVDSTIKCIGFKSFHYAINLDVVSSFMIFSNFDYIFISMYCLLETMKLFFFQKKKRKKKMVRYKNLTQ